MEFSLYFAEVGRATLQINVDVIVRTGIRYYTLPRWEFCDFLELNISQKYNVQIKRMILKLSVFSLR